MFQQVIEEKFKEILVSAIVFELHLIEIQDYFQERRQQAGS